MLWADVFVSVCPVQRWPRTAENWSRRDQKKPEKQEDSVRQMPEVSQTRLMSFSISFVSRNEWLTLCGIGDERKRVIFSLCSSVISLAVLLKREKTSWKITDQNNTVCDFYCCLFWGVCHNHGYSARVCVCVCACTVCVWTCFGFFVTFSVINTRLNEVLTSGPNVGDDDQAWSGWSSVVMLKPVIRFP